MLERRLLHTAITREITLCLLVGDPRALVRTVENWIARVGRQYVSGQFPLRQESEAA
jgi:hypothetical protein